MSTAVLERYRPSLHVVPAAALASDVDVMADDLRFERYVGRSQTGNPSLVRRAYYTVRPLLPVKARRHLQRMALRGWDRLERPDWPIDTSVEKLLEKELLAAASDRDVDAIPFVWFWPNRKAACVVLTHDIETKQGRDYTETIMELESRRGFVASYEVVPESRYAVSDDFLASIRAGGCEVCVHDLNHDGRLFSSLTTFKERVKRINEYGQQYGARGFRSAVMYRHADWMPCLAYSYDMSFPNVAHLDPQRGGCCTVFPYFIGGVLELPLTATQDYTLLHVLRADSDVIWRRQTEGVLNEHGLLTFIVHPDYVIDRRGAHLHDRLLEMLNVLVEERSVWSALPGDVDSWWRQRAQMRVTRVSGAWAVVGPGSDRASVAWAHCQDGRIEVEV